MNRALDFIPYSYAFLASCGCDTCPCCAGAGIANGFRLHGRLCPCVVRCEFCDAPMPYDDDHFADGRPKRLDGLPACKDCRDRAASEAA